MHLKFAFLMKNGFNCMKLFDFVKQRDRVERKSEGSENIRGGADVGQINSSTRTFYLHATDYQQETDATLGSAANRTTMLKPRTVEVGSSSGMGFQSGEITSTISFLQGNQSLGHNISDASSSGPCGHLKELEIARYISPKMIAFDPLCVDAGSTKL